MNAVITTIIKRLAVIISVFAIVWCLIDPVYADDSSTFYVVDDCFIYLTYTSGSNTNYAKMHADSTVNAFLYGTYSSNSFNGYVYLVSDSSFTYWITSGATSTTCPTGYTYTSYSATVDNNNFYYAVFSCSKSNVSDIYLPVNYNSSLTSNAQIAYYYVYGDGAVDPEESISYGLLNNVGYSTTVAGQGNAAVNNIDNITWDSTYDSLGNDISDGTVNIRVVPGSYTAESNTSILEQLYTDFILDSTNLVDLDSVSVSNGSYSISWSDVIDTLNFSFPSVISVFQTDSAWLKYGWIYQYQLVVDDYESDWSTIYTSTSSGVENDLTIINSTTITQSTITAIQQINTINNSTNTWIVNDIPVDPDDTYTPPESDDEKPWWAYLLEMINNSLGITNQYISDGTDESQEVVNNIETNNTDLDVTVNEYQDIEDDLVTDMNDNVTDLDLDEDLTSDTSFLTTAEWITEQFNTIVSDNPIGMILKFSLVLGFVTIFLGRFR